jgi:mono/diheme cytochrome c family protein
MNSWTEGKAAIAAIITSAMVLGGTFGFAQLMRGSRFARSPSAPGLAPIETAAVSLDADRARGRHLFLMNCAHCHGDDARGDEGPDLHDLRKSDARIHQVITAGIKGEMPSFAKKLGDEDIRAVTAYLRTLKG